ncbi:hypothetical protein AB0R01_14885 [Streptomyces rochei]|uniref:hypothetical protein n=1 Tax=Streptomyces TaxID=1883 RepID=UPI001CC1BA4C|nr:hypothetical protein [Streptomyces sp. A144]UAX56819.1 hypothetical protein K5X85_29260 [Streptomyces sp. A144]
MKVSKYWKAVVGGLAAGAAALTTALEDGVITAAEGSTAIVAVLGAAGLTWLVPNRTTTTDANRE